MVGLYRRLEGKNRKLRFVAVDEIIDWHKNIFRCNEINTYRHQAFSPKLTNTEECIDCAYAHTNCLHQEPRVCLRMFFYRKMKEK